MFYQNRIVSCLSLNVAGVLALGSVLACSSKSGGPAPLLVNPTDDTSAAGAPSGGAGGSAGDAGTEAGGQGPVGETEPVACQLASASDGCDACLADFCDVGCGSCAGEVECANSYECVIDTCLDAEFETDVECVIDCASELDTAASTLYALIDCGKLNCPGYCYF